MIGNEVDNYWAVLAEDRYDLNVTPPNLYIGSINDDIQNLKEILFEVRSANVCDLERFINVMNAFIDIINQSNYSYKK